MSRTKRAISGFSADIIGQVVTQLISFIAIPIYTQNLSDISYGYWLTIGSIIMWISLSDFGIGMALSRLLIKIQATKEHDELKAERNSLITTALIMFMILALLFFALGSGLYPFCLRWFRVESAEVNVFRITYFICITAGAISLPSSVFPGVLEAHQKLALNRNLSTLGTMTNVLISVVLVYTLKSIEALAYSLLISVLIKGIASHWYSTKISPIRVNKVYLSKSYAKQLFSAGGYFQIARVANTVATNSDNLFISSYISAGTVPMYSFTSKLAQLFGITLASKIPNVLFAGMSEIIDLKQSEKLKVIFHLLIKILIRLGLLTATYCYFFNVDFVSLWVGKQNYGGYWLNLIICYWIIYEFVARGSTALVFAFGDFKGYAYASILEIIGNVILSIILIQKYGLFGVALATAISRTLTTGVYLVWYFNTKELLTKELLLLMLKVIVFSIPTILTFLILRNLHLNIGWIELALIGIFGLFVNFLTFDLAIILKNRHLPIKEIINKAIFNL